jgi:hypothetical protein
MGDPLKASVNQSGWRKDSAGLMLPMGGGSSAKIFLQLPKEVQDIATSANTIARGNFAKELWPRLAMLSTIAGPDHVRTKMFIANITAGSMAEGGQASIKALMAMVNMLMPSALPTANGHHQMDHKVKKRNEDNDNGRVVNE